MIHIDKTSKAYFTGNVYKLGAKKYLLEGHIVFNEENNEAMAAESIAGDVFILKNKCAVHRVVIGNVNNIEYSKSHDNLHIINPNSDGLTIFNYSTLDWDLVNIAEKNIEKWQVKAKRRGSRGLLYTSLLGFLAGAVERNVNNSFCPSYENSRFWDNLINAVSNQIGDKKHHRDIHNAYLIAIQRIGTF